MMNSDLVVGPLAHGLLREQVLDLAATGRAGLAALLGDAVQRHALFRPGMRADRFLVATVEGQLAGYVSLKYAGQGPFAPGLTDFIRCHGWRRGTHAFAVFAWIEARTRPRPGGADIYGMDILKPWRGHKRGRDVGGARMRAAMAATAGLGLTTLDMEVRHANSRALALRMGARPVMARRLSRAGLLLATAGEYTRYSIAINPAASGWA